MVIVYQLCRCGQRCVQPPCPRCSRGGARRPHQRRLARASSRERAPRPSRHQRGYDYAWVKLRERILREHPLCRPCLLEGRCRPAEEVHHVVPIRQAPELRLAIENLVPVCKACHRRLERHAPTTQALTPSPARRQSR